MIYLDTSCALAQLLAEDTKPPAVMWSEPLVASRLLQYELWNRLHAHRVASSHGPAAEELLARVSIVELAAPVLTRALDPFPVPVRTLDALHLATMGALLERRLDVCMATFDQRMANACRALGWPLFDVWAGCA